MGNRTSTKKDSRKGAKEEVSIRNVAQTGNVCSSQLLLNGGANLAIQP
jgi:hypothetical protein